MGLGIGGILSETTKSTEHRLAELCTRGSLSAFGCMPVNAGVSLEHISKTIPSLVSAELIDPTAHIRSPMWHFLSVASASWLDYILPLTTNTMSLVGSYSKAISRNCEEAAAKIV